MITDCLGVSPILTWKLVMGFLGTWFGAGMGRDREIVGVLVEVSLLSPLHRLVRSLWFSVRPRYGEK